MVLVETDVQSFQFRKQVAIKMRLSWFALIALMFVACVQGNWGKEAATDVPVTTQEPGSGEESGDESDP